MNLLKWIMTKKAVPVVKPILLKTFNGSEYFGKSISVTRDVTIGETMVEGQYYDWKREVGGEG